MLSTIIFGRSRMEINMSFRHCRKFSRYGWNMPRLWIGPSIRCEEITSKRSTKTPFSVQSLTVFPRDFQRHNMTQRKKSLDDMHSQLRKYIGRIPMVVVCYTKISLLGRMQLLRFVVFHHPAASRCSHLPSQHHGV